MIVGIAGGTASGKTALAQRIVEAIGPSAMVIHSDDYYKPLGHRAGVSSSANFDSPDAIDTKLLVAHLKKLKANECVDMPQYDYRTHTRTGHRVVQPHPILIVEGLFVLTRTEIRELLDIKLFIDVSPDLRFIRRLQRDVQERGRDLAGIVLQYTHTVRPMHLAYVEPSVKHADVIITHGGFSTAVALVAALARERLGQRA